MKMRAILLALLLPALAMPAGTVRMTTWDLSDNVQPGLAQEAAQPLKKLNPDIILLQHVADWTTCQRIADAMGPHVYHVITCSSSYNSHGRRISQEAAILAKTRAYMSWSEPWEAGGESPAAPGGFCFAALRIAGKNLGVFSIQPGDGAAELQARQLCQKIASLQNWKVNRLQAYAIAGNSAAATQDFGLKQINFTASVGPLGLWMRDAVLASPPLVTRVDHFTHEAVSYEIDLSPPPRVLPAPPPVQKAACGGSASASSPGGQE